MSATTTPTPASNDPLNHLNQRSPLPSRNPIPLSAAQEAQVRETYYKRVRALCAPEIKEFAKCATGRTITMTWACRDQRNAMNSCMISHATPEEEDRAREEWFAQRSKRIRERQKKEEKQKLQTEFHKHWWGIDGKGNWGVDPSEKKEAGKD